MKHLIVLALAGFGLAPRLGARQLHALAGEPGTHSYFGHSLAALGDLDADGVFDFAVGVPYEPSCGSLGEVRVYSGATGAPLLPAVDDCGERGSFGYSVAAVGDLNGDGIPDLVVGAPYFSGVGVGHPGAAAALSGLDGALLHRIVGDRAYDSFGISVAGLGDVDLDGVPDWAVGATDDGTTPALGQGYVRVVSGASGATIRTLLRTGASASRYGQSVLGPGDVNFDGLPDVLVGAGNGGGSVQMRSGLNGGVLWTRTGPAGARFGWASDRAGDVDADGALDLVVGSSFGALARILRARDGALVLEVHGPAGDFFGGSVAGLGDLDLDGHDDFAVGSKWEDAGQAFVGSVRVYSGQTGSVLRRHDGSASYDRYGIALAGAGDLDQDGRSELLIGANQDANGEPGYVEARSVSLHPLRKRGDLR